MDGGFRNNDITSLMCLFFNGYVGFHKKNEINNL